VTRRRGHWLRAPVAPTACAAVLMLGACNAEKKEQEAAAAAARRAQQVAPPSTADAPPATNVSLHAAGKNAFDGTMDARAGCTFQESAGDRFVQVEGFSRDAQLSFVVLNPREGGMTVADVGRRRRGVRRLTNLEVTVHGPHSSGGRGSATITDPAGRSGSLSAVVTSTGRHSRGTLNVRISWACE